MKPSTTQSLRYTEARTPIGKIFIVVGPDGVCALHLLEDRPSAALARETGRRLGAADIVEDRIGLKPVVEQINGVLNGSLSPGRLKLDMKGTPFQKKVWEEMLRVRRGETCSYSELAQRVGRPRAVRAVASACARNPIALVVPCHRILRNDGSLGGYYYGLQRKREILEWESGVGR